MENAPGSGIQPFGALSDHHEVDLTGLDVGQRAYGPRPQTGRSEIHILVEIESQLQQQSTFENARRNRRIAYRSQQDRIVLVEFLLHGLGKNLAGVVIAPGAEVVFVDLQVRQSDLEHLSRLRDDFGADTVAGDRCDPNHAGILSIACAHGRRRLESRPIAVLRRVTSRRP